jgi:hypothetical protein
VHDLGFLQCVHVCIQKNWIPIPTIPSYGQAGSIPGSTVLSIVLARGAVSPGRPFQTRLPCFKRTTRARKALAPSLATRPSPCARIDALPPVNFPQERLHEAASAADAFACSKETIWEVPDFPDRRGLRKDRSGATMKPP